MPTLPRKVYRYRALNAFTLDALCHDQLYFASPSDFNDPLDCSPNLEADSDNATLRSVLRALLAKRIHDEAAGALAHARIRKNEAAEKHLRRIAERDVEAQLSNIAYMATNPEYEVSKEEAESWLLTQEIQRELTRQYDSGVCCFSSAYDNPLLWSHYGDQHKGICIGYGLDRDPPPHLRRVVYGGNRLIMTSTVAKAVLHGDAAAKDQIEQNMLLRKAAPWRYEREWRIVDNVGLNDSCLQLLEVTFGLRCPAALAHMVACALEGREVPVAFHQMHERRDSFRLGRRPLDVDELKTYFPKVARSGTEIFGKAAD